MKIRSKIALRYTAVTAIFLLLFAMLIYFTSAQDREREFYHDLKREGASKANLFFESKASPEVLHDIYKNNIAYIDEVEVAIYDTNFNILYHDDVQLDIVKETPELLNRILNQKLNTEFYVDKYQAVGFVFRHHNTPYIVTAAAYDGYGYAKLWRMAINLFILSLVGILTLWILGYYLAKRALKPVAEITEEMKSVMSSKLFPTLKKRNEKDEIGELAQQFERALSIIETSYDSQKMFISSVSHELRTPLSTLTGEIDIALLKDRSIDQYKEILRNSRQDADRLIRLTNDLLDLAKASYDSSKIAMNEIRIDEVLLDARETVLKSNKDYSVDLVFNQEIDNDSEMTVLGNEYLLRIAFLNLMENNCKFSENKTSTVSINAWQDRLLIQFTDSGIGIPSDEIGHIFVPFYRGKNRDFSAGNGIGMALVEKVITLHNGSIAVTSDVGIGTSFAIHLHPINNVQA